MTTKKLTEKSEALLISLFNDSANWSGTPMFQGDQKDNGNLVDLKKKGYLETFEYDEGDIFIAWTDFGKATADSMGIHLGIED